jgi:hypothetical protein
LGKYLSKIAGCEFCHTPQVDSEPPTDMVFAGGHEFLLPTGEMVRSSNITPDEETGIGDWDKETFIMMFKELGNVEELVEVNRNSFNTIMPWSMYAGMTEEDLGAIFIYNRLNLLKMILKYLFEIIINTILPLLGGERGVGK